ncbi:MAG: hypothetical protein ACRD20_02375 [Terriglobales bacterium]
MDARAQAVVNSPSYIHPELSFYNPPADSLPFTVTPIPFPAYPLVGANPVVIIQYVVPNGLLAVINKLSVVHVGGNPPDGTGQVIWRVLKNGAGITGMNNLTSEFGTYSNPKSLVIVAVENDILQVTVELPANLPDGTPNTNMPAGATTAASFDGYTYPLSEATLYKAGR